MKTWTLIAGLATCLSLANAQEKPKDRPGWVPMFDGKSLSGWHTENKATWTVDQGIVLGSGGGGWLRSDQTYSDFLLRLEFRNSPKGNSGVFLRAGKESKAGEPQNPAQGYELQIYNEDPKWATGSIEDVIQRLTPVNPAPFAWHRYEVEIRGNHLTAALDGVKVLDGHDSQLKSGYIGLQHHKDNKIEFRNVVIRPILGK
jgi:hypothetical protein